MNYLLHYDDLEKAFRQVRLLLDEDGIFLFDLTTEHNILKYFDSTEESFDHQGTEISWSNEYDKKNKLITSTLYFSGKQTTVEKHVQRIYTQDEILPILKRTGLVLLSTQSDYTFNPPDRTTVMENYIVRRL
jgi:hypothetical protein